MLDKFFKLNKKIYKFYYFFNINCFKKIKSEYFILDQMVQKLLFLREIMIYDVDDI